MSEKEKKIEKKDKQPKIKNMEWHSSIPNAAPDSAAPDEDIPQEHEHGHKKHKKLDPRLIYEQYDCFTTLLNLLQMTHSVAENTGTDFKSSPFANNNFEIGMFNSSCSEEALRQNSAAMDSMMMHILANTMYVFLTGNRHGNSVAEHTLNAINDLLRVQANILNELMSTRHDIVTELQYLNGRRNMESDESTDECCCGGLCCNEGDTVVEEDSDFGVIEAEQVPTFHHCTIGNIFINCNDECIGGVVDMTHPKPQHIFRPHGPITFPHFEDEDEWDDEDEEYDDDDEGEDEE